MPTIIIEFPQKEILLVPVDRAARRFLTVVQSLKTHASGVWFKLLFICDSARLQ